MSLTNATITQKEQLSSLSNSEHNEHITRIVIDCNCDLTLLKHFNVLTVLILTENYTNYFSSITKLNITHLIIKHTKNSITFEFLRNLKEGDLPNLKHLALKNYNSDLEYLNTLISLTHLYLPNYSRHNIDSLSRLLNLHTLFIPNYSSTITGLLGNTNVSHLKIKHFKGPVNDLIEIASLLDINILKEDTFDKQEIVSYIKKLNIYILSYFPNLDGVDLPAITTGNLVELPNTIKFLFINSFNGDLTPLLSIPSLTALALDSYTRPLPSSFPNTISFLTLNSFNGDLTPILSLPSLNVLKLNSYTKPLPSLPNTISELFLNSFTGDLTPILSLPSLNFLELDSYTRPLPSFPNTIHILSLYSFNGDLTPILSLPSLESLSLNSYTRPLPSSMPNTIESLNLDSFKGDLTPISSLSNLNMLSLNSYTRPLPPSLPTTIEILDLYSFKGDVGPIYAILPRLIGLNVHPDNNSIHQRISTIQNAGASNNVKDINYYRLYKKYKSKYLKLRNNFE